MFHYMARGFCRCDQGSKPAGSELIKPEIILGGPNLNWPAFYKQTVSLPGLGGRKQTDRLWTACEEKQPLGDVSGPRQGKKMGPQL